MQDFLIKDRKRIRLAHVDIQYILIEAGEGYYDTILMFPVPSGNQTQYGKSQFSMVKSTKNEHVP